MLEWFQVNQSQNKKSTMFNIFSYCTVKKNPKSSYVKNECVQT